MIGDYHFVREPGLPNVSMLVDAGMAVQDIGTVEKESEFGMCEIHSDVSMRPTANRREKKYAVNHGGNKEKFDLPGVILICPECYSECLKKRRGDNKGGVQKRFPATAPRPLW